MHLVCILVFIRNAKRLPDVQFERLAPRCAERNAKNFGVEACDREKLLYEAKNALQFGERGDTLDGGKNRLLKIFLL